MTTNYDGWLLINEDLTELAGAELPIYVRKLENSPAECDLCSVPDNPVDADYVVDAVAVLGPDAGHNAHYCQRCMKMCVELDDTADRWYAPVPR